MYIRNIKKACSVYTRIYPFVYFFYFLSSHRNNEITSQPVEIVQWSARCNCVVLANSLERDVEWAKNREITSLLEVSSFTVTF